MTTTASLFTGGGLWDVGAKMAGFTPVWGVEIRPDIATWAERNIPGLRVIVSDVAAVDYSSLPRVDHLHASPSCKKASVANSGGGESPEDIEAARAVCRAIEAVGPQSFTLENVWGYREFEAFKLIVGQLVTLGYKLDWWHLNSADYGVPQTRKRLILIARKDRQPTRPQPTHSDTPDAWGVYKPWIGWLEAIADLVDSLPDSEFAPWQLERLPAELKSMLLAQGSFDGEVVNRSIEEPAFTMTANSNQGGLRALLVPGDNGSNFTTVRSQDEPMVTVQTRSLGQCPHRAFLVNKSADKFSDGVNYAESRAFSVVASSQGRYKAFVAMEPKRPARASVGRVVKMTPRALARLQSVPDEYVLPDHNGLACEIIGNGVPCLLAKAICESLKD